MCSIGAEHLIDVVPKIVIVFFVSLIFGAIDIACGVHTKMDVRVRLVLMHGGDNLVLARVVLNAFFSDFFCLLDGNAFIGGKTQRCVAKMYALLVVIRVGHTLHGLRGAGGENSATEHLIWLFFPMRGYVADTTLNILCGSIIARFFNHFINSHMFLILSSRLCRGSASLIFFNIL